MTRGRGNHFRHDKGEGESFQTWRRGRGIISGMMQGGHAGTSGIVSMDRGPAKQKIQSTIVIKTLFLVIQAISRNT